MLEEAALQHIQRIVPDIQHFQMRVVFEGVVLESGYATMVQVQVLQVLQGLE